MPDMTGAQSLLARLQRELSQDDAPSVIPEVKLIHASDNEQQQSDEEDHKS
eukprot:UN08209